MLEIFVRFADRTIHLGDGTLIEPGRYYPLDGEHRFVAHRVGLSRTHPDGYVIMIKRSRETVRNGTIRFYGNQEENGLRSFVLDPRQPVEPYEELIAALRNLGVENWQIFPVRGIPTTRALSLNTRATSDGGIRRYGTTVREGGRDVSMVTYHLTGNPTWVVTRTTQDGNSQVTGVYLLPGAEAPDKQAALLEAVAALAADPLPATA